MTYFYKKEEGLQRQFGKAGINTLPHDEEKSLFVGIMGLVGREIEFPHPMEEVRVGLLKNVIWRVGQELGSHIATLRQDFGFAESITATPIQSNGAKVPVLLRHLLLHRRLGG